MWFDPPGTSLHGPPPGVAWPGTALKELPDWFPTTGMVSALSLASVRGSGRGMWQKGGPAGKNPNGLDWNLGSMVLGAGDLKAFVWEKKPYPANPPPGLNWK
jgi:hypothetical protein